MMYYNPFSVVEGQLILYIIAVDTHPHSPMLILTEPSNRSCLRVGDFWYGERITMKKVSSKIQADLGSVFDNKFRVKEFYNRKDELKMSQREYPSLKQQAWCIIICRNCYK
jgi:hypothetical protein